MFGKRTFTSANFSVLIQKTGWNNSEDESFASTNFSTIFDNLADFRSNNTTVD